VHSVNSPTQTPFSPARVATYSN